MSEQISPDFKLSAYSYPLPEERIAQHPADQRDQSRLMVYQPEDDHIKHHRFQDILDYIQAGDLLVVNNTEVFPARLFGHKETGGKVEIFLLEYPLKKACGTTFSATALLKASKRPKKGTTIKINRALNCTVTELLEGGKAQLEIHCPSEETLATQLDIAGQVPLPPYINRKTGTTAEDRKRYQTVFAKTPGAVAAPTAGLHFTEKLLKKIQAKGANVSHITLHVGYGTFAPVREEDIRRHNIHSEYLTIPPETVESVRQAKAAGGKIWAVGTTSVRSLEFAAQETGEIQETSAWCNLYIYPGFKFRVVDNLITNFHLPNSSLMFLVSAFCGSNGQKKLLSCYNKAVEKEYRFFSYGDAMAILSPRSR